MPVIEAIIPPPKKIAAPGTYKGQGATADEALADFAAKIDAAAIIKP